MSSIASIIASIAAITTTQCFSRRGIGYLWNRRAELDPGQVAIIGSIYNNRKKSSIECKQTITYSLSKSKAGALGYGRFYGTKGSLETLERECRGTLCSDYYHDIDIVNCHPVLLVQYAKRLGKTLPEVERLVDNRDAFLSAVGGSRDDAKTEIIRVFYGGKNTNEYLAPLALEVRNFTKFLSGVEEHAELWKYSKTQDNIYGCYLSYILQTEERKCMLAMKSSLEAGGWSVDVLAYDGVMVLKRDADLDAAMRAAEKAVMQATGYDIKLTNKPMSSFEVPALSEEIEKGVTMDAYLEMKGRFEETNFYYAPTNEMFEIRGDDIARMSLEHAREYYSTNWRFAHSQKFSDYTTFFDVWRKDSKRKVVHRIDMKPSSDPSVFVMPPRFAWTTATSNDSIDLFLELIKNMGGQEQQQYILNWLAHLVQKPFDLPGVALIITGLKGCGKDTLFDFISKYVIGPSYSHKYASNEQFFDRHDDNRMNKFLCKLEEANRNICLRNADTLKALVTSYVSTVNPKCQKAITVPNYNRFVFTTNGGCPVEMKDGERRFVIAACSPKYVGNMAFWTKVRAELFTEAAGAAVGEYLASLDISDFDVRKLPVDAFQQSIVESEISSEMNFIQQWDGESLSATDFFNAYRDYCSINQLPHAMNAMSLGVRLLIPVRDGLLIKTRTADGIRYKKPGM